MTIAIKKPFAPSDIIQVTVQGKCTHADTQTTIESDWFGNDIEVERCYFCNEELV